MFTEYEKIIARNINKKYKWIARDYDGSLWVFMNKPNKVRGNWYESSTEANLLRAFIHMFSSIKWEDDEPTLIKDIYDPQILDEQEREYLNTILKPFHEKVDYVVKFGDSLIDEDDGNSYRKEYLYIKLYDGQLSFPDFDPGKMYSGMEVDKKYKLDELGIKY